ncbi:MAG: hypothetical protein BZY81_01195 [SAR202 cluster bacterium Io17-Chloro-G4]|nr:MAG: hypothetical protein BZY81_01195 [SAR202 cluster bacterium Io17-Chloro-G4]
MDVAIIGLPMSGKTTVFNALTRGNADTTGPSEMHVGVVKVADPRLYVLADIFHPRKIIHAEVKYWDLPGPESLANSQGLSGKYLNVLQAADAFLLVVRTFTDPSVPHPTYSDSSEVADPGRDLSAMLDELTLADLVVLDRGIERLEDGMKKAKTTERPAIASQMETVRKAKLGLEAGIPMWQQQFTGSETAFLNNYQLLTFKRVIVAFNTDEDGPEVSLESLGLTSETSTGLGHVSLSGKLEADLAMMSDDEAEEFRTEMGIGESAVSRVVNASYDTLGLVSFLTVGEDEVRAWSVDSGMPAQEAAGIIHTDFTRGFIRAEVIAYGDLIRCGSIAQGRKEGLLRSEGKTYGVKDGDVINFLINV